jgi:hypothetical protein
VIIMGFVLVDTASAGTYVMRTCNVPGQSRSTVGPWRFFDGGGTVANNDCANGGGFGLNVGPAMTSGYAASVAFGTGPSVAIRRVRLWLVARLAGTGSTMYVVTQYSDGTPGPPATGLFATPGGDTLTTPYATPELPADTRVFAVYLNCGIDAGACMPNVTSVLDIRGAEATLEEQTLPTASITGGELMADGPQSGVRALAYTANDAHSGVARVSAVIGKTVVAISDFSSECAHADIAACPQTRTTTLAADTRKVPDGIYPVSLVVTDAAGNEQTVQASTAIRVENGASALGPSSGGLVSNARLTAAFAANRRSTVTVGYGRRVVIRGRLRGPDGAPISGAQINISPSRANATPGVATTGPDGIFAYTVGRGTSRVLTLTYPGIPAAVKQLRLRVKSSATLRVALKGIVVRYRGRVISKPLPGKGKLVEIQGKAPGAGKTFAKRRTDRRGAFAGTYRLRVRRPGVHLQFRVRVPREGGYPFVAHAGRAVTRIVR